MKQLIISAAFLCAIILVLPGCASETDAAIDDFEQLVDEMIVTAKGMNKKELKTSPKAIELAEKGKELQKRIEKLKDDFTPEQKARLASIMQKGSEAAGDMH